MNVLVVLPIVTPLITAALCLLVRRQLGLQKFLAVTGSALLLAWAGLLLRSTWSDGILVVQTGGWPAPFGITLVADLFAAIMTLLAALTGFATVLYSLATIDEKRASFGYYAMLNFLLMGVCAAFLTGDIFNLYVAFEVMLMASFILLALGGEAAQIQAAIKYVTLNLISSFFFLSGVGLLYAMTGTLNMAALAMALRDLGNPGLITTVSMLFLVAFGIKAAVFPLFFWLPDSYHTPPVAVSSLFAGLLTKVGVYALIRVFTLLFVGDISYTHDLILAISGLTMITGVLGALAQNEFRRILSFHIISQIGYMTMGLGLFTIVGLAGSIFYIIHHIVVKANLFLISGVVHRLRGSFELKELGGVYAAYPGVALLFIVPAMSLAGIPPLSGFFAKLTLIQAGLGAERYAIAAVALFTGLLTLMSMTKIWSEVFWKSPPEGAAAKAVTAGLSLAPVVLLVAVTILISLGAGPVFMLSTEAAMQLLEPEPYIRAVLGGQP
jgi:multicomponent Na+:H+ antiporter subunit D